MRVSVLINNYNYGRFLDECLSSLDKQTVKADEVILYDDGSSDNSIEIASKYSFVKVISNPNFGKKPAFNQGNAINTAFKESTGDIICLLDSDDFFHEQKIEKVKLAFVNKDIVLVQHAYFEYRNSVAVRKVDYSRQGINYLDLYKKNNWTGFFNPTSTLSFSRDYLVKVLPIIPDEQWRVWPDVRLSRISPYYGDVVCLKTPLTFYRRHGSNDSGFMNQDFKKYLLNQESHHDYINQRLIELGQEKINYKMSFKYFKFKIKTFLPSFLVHIIHWLNSKK
jgi:glycosyltransferase involved in cell wall biosynthesis